MISEEKRQPWSCKIRGELHLHMIWNYNTITINVPTYNIVQPLQS